MLKCNCVCFYEILALFDNSYDYIEHACLIDNVIVRSISMVVW